jgi:hypothetical protein
LSISGTIGQPDRARWWVAASLRLLELGDQPAAVQLFMRVPAQTPSFRGAGGPGFVLRAAGFTRRLGRCARGAQPGIRPGGRRGAVFPAAEVT